LQLRDGEKKEIIMPNPLVKLDYSPAEDVLSVAWPDFSDYAVSEAVHILDIVLDTLRCYDVKYLLTDTRGRMVDVPDTKYKEIILNFAKGLAKTRLQKLARVVTESSLREEPINQVRQETHLTIPLRNFYSVEEAFGWLTSK
jgi:nucleotide-binding universal stress UspA family protein